MSVKVMSWVWDCSRSRGAQRLVLLAIADHANDDGLDAFPSLARLARKTGMTERGVHKAIQALCALGELQVTAGGGRGRSNRYRVLMLNQTQNEVPSSDDTNPEPETMNDVPRTTFHEPDSRNATTANPEPGSTEPSMNHQEKSSSKTSTPEPPRSDVAEICSYLADRIEENGSRRPAITKRWHDAARLLLDKDARTVEQVKRAIDWCQSDDFWKANILSMPTLREKYDRLRLAAQRPGAARGAPHRPYTNPTDPNAYREGL